jgi:chromosome segregation ATPase
MDDQQRQRINGVAREFADALVAAYRTTSDGTAAAQRLGAQQIEYFFDTVMDNLRAQTEGTSQVTRQLATQQELAREATRELARVSTDNYMDFLDSVFSFYHGGASRTQRRAEETRRRVQEAEARAERAEKGRREAERQAAEAKKGTEEAQGRVEEAEKSARAAQSRAQKAERSTKEAEERAEEAESRAREAEERAGAAQSRVEEAERSAEEADRRAEQAERSRSEAESRGGDQGEEESLLAPASPRSQSIWVRTSGRSKVRGRNPRSRGGRPGEGRAKLLSDDPQGTEQTTSPAVRSMAVAGMAGVSSRRRGPRPPTGPSG